MSIIIDFEGEPARPLAERRRKASPLRDVAGLLRSFDYAAPRLIAAQERRRPRAVAERRATLPGAVPRRATAAFLQAYRDGACRRTRRGCRAAEQALLDLFLIEKAAYEIGYEAANRPTGSRIPLRGLAAAGRRALTRDGAGRMT